MKERKIFKNLLRVTKQFIQGRSYSPMTRAELMKKLYLPPVHREIFKEVLKELVANGTLKLSKNRYIPLQPGADIIKGALSLHPRGFGFVSPKDTTLYQQDIFIPKHLTQTAVDGDLVEVKVNPVVSSEKGPEGQIIAVLERGRTHIAGIVSKIEWQGDILAYVPILGMTQRVVIEPTNEFSLQLGDRVVMEVLDWGSKNTETTCRATHHLGPISDPSCDIPAAIEEYELRADFPSEAIREAKKLAITESAIADREDFRKETCVTIDPDTAKDFDDALCLTKDRQGNYHLGVHIADVSYFVQPNSALDKEALLRSNSTYFPGYCLPMLPAELSENLCSLVPNEDRLVASVLMTFNKQGDLTDYRITRGVIRSEKRFTYRQALEVIEGKKSPYSKLLKTMVELCKLLKKKRYERGSLEFSIPEMVIKLDDHGTPYGTELVEYDITHQMVEEFMLKANEVVAQHLSKQGKQLPYRVHEEPSKENMEEFSLLATLFGFNLAQNPTPQQLQEFFDEALKTSFGQYLAVNYIRRMRLAIYSPDNIGHYGLGLEHYCHFTSPIRRYVDLVIHRTLFGGEISHEQLESIAKYSSEQERISEKAENNVVLLKKLRLLDLIHQKDSHKQYEAVVTRVRHFGIYFEIKDLLLDCFLHVSELDDDYFEFDDESAILRGQHTDKAYFAGDEITVMLRKVDLVFLESKWELVQEEL